jgi:hypothetical protein
MNTPLRFASLFLVILGVQAVWPQVSSVAEQRDRLDGIALDFYSKLRAARFPATVTEPRILLDTPSQLSVYDPNDNAVHTSQWNNVPPQVRALFDRWAGFIEYDTKGEQLFDAIFHRFFFVHELGHWIQFQSFPQTDRYVSELEADRISTAYWKEQDPEYLSKFVVQVRRIHDRLPNPVPVGEDAVGFFQRNYVNLGSNPPAYGWYQFGMVITASQEHPVPRFADLIKKLANQNSAQP